MRPQRFLAACRREPTDTTPVWFMRQAGRSLPAYRALRARHAFLDVIAHPEQMAEVTLMPLDELDVDAAIMFADIMLPMAALGIGFDIVESVGPVIAEPIRTRAQVEALARIPVAEAAPSVFEAIRIVRKELDGRVPLIGFSGGPFTLACYLVEGRASREFNETRAFMHAEPDAWRLLMERLTELVIEYLDEQVAAGAQAWQLFDSWVGVLARGDYERAVLPHSARIFSSVPGVPRIHFGTGTGSILDLMASVDCEVVGVDHRTPLDRARALTGDRVLQGNLDPAVLLADASTAEAAARDVLTRGGGTGHIFNLGHGVLPGSKLDNLKRVVEVVHGG